MAEHDRDTNWTDLPRDLADLLAALVQSSDDAIYSKDPDARITSWNAAAERLYGYAYNEMIGQPISLLIPDDRKGEELDILNRVLDGERLQHFETKRRRKDGSLIDVSVSVSPVHDSEGNIIECAVIARDISLRLEAEGQLARERRKEALDLNDTVVQGLAAAKLALEMSRYDDGLETLTTTLDRAKTIVSRLLAEAGDVDHDDLTRNVPASLDEKTKPS